MLFSVTFNVGMREVYGMLMGAAGKRDFGRRREVPWFSAFFFHVVGRFGQLSFSHASAVCLFAV